MSYGIAVGDRLSLPSDKPEGIKVMQKVIPDDDFWKVRMGRFSDSDEIEIKRLFRRKPRREQSGRIAIPRPYSLSDQALAARARAIDTGWQRNNGPEVIVKAVGTTKSKSGTFGMIRYIARLRHQDRRTGQYCQPKVYDEFGSHVVSEKLKDKINEWDLLNNEQNTSKRARALLEADQITDFNELKTKERLHYIQARHFAFSIVSDNMKVDSKKLKNATLATIDSLFTSRGYKVLWTIHTDCERRPHAHLIVKAQSEFGRRLWLNSAGDYFDTMKTELVINLAAVGLSFQAPRREDRPWTRRSVMSGEEPLRSGKSIMECHNGLRRLSRRVPAWFDRFGAAYLEQRNRKINEVAGQSRSKKGIKHWLSGKVSRKVGGARIAKEQKRTPDVYHALLGEIRNGFSYPCDALISWQNMAMEGAYRAAKGNSVYPNKRLADWYLTNQPTTFGKVTSAASGFNKNIRLRRLLKKAILPAPEFSPNRIYQGIHKITSPEIRISHVNRDRIKAIASLIHIADISEGRWKTTYRPDRIRRLALRSLETPINNHFYSPSPAHQPSDTDVRILPTPSVTIDKPIREPLEPSSKNQRTFMPERGRPVER